MKLQLRAFGHLQSVHIFFLKGNCPIFIKATAGARSGNLLDFTVIVSFPRHHSERYRAGEQPTMGFVSKMMLAEIALEGSANEV